MKQAFSLQHHRVNEPRAALLRRFALGWCEPDLRSGPSFIRNETSGRPYIAAPREGCSPNEKATSRRATYLLAIAAADNKHSDAETGDGHGGGFRNDIAVDADPEAFIGITKRAE